jgi:hypothetical protein
MASAPLIRRRPVRSQMSSIYISSAITRNRRLGLGLLNPMGSGDPADKPACCR